LINVGERRAGAAMVRILSDRGRFIEVNRLRVGGNRGIFAIVRNAVFAEKDQIWPRDETARFEAHLA